MDIARLKKTPFHIFLLPVFYVTHASNEYYGLFPLQTPLLYLSYYLALSALVFATGWLLFRSVLKAGCWAIILLIIFFFFGKAHDLLRENSILKQISSYKIVLPVILTIIVILSIYIKKTSHSFKKVNSYFNIIFCFFVLLEIADSSIKYFSKAGKKNDLALQNLPVNIWFSPMPDTAKPDIFFIVFDEYTSSASLKKYLNYDNSGLDSSLSANGFYVVKNSKSNYNATVFSLASAFNLQYFNIQLEHVSPEPKPILKGQYSFYKSRVPKILKKEGYTIKNIGILNLEDYPAPQTSFFQKGYETIFYEETIWNRIKREILWNITSKFPEKIIMSYKKQQEKEVKNYTSNFKNILTELQTQNDTPKFIYGHIFMPHRPYYLNRNGEFMNTILNYTGYSRDSLYLEQVIFCNTWIDSMAKATNQPFKRPRIIIIEGDHGYRDANDNQHIRNRELMNLSAFYFSDNDYSALYDSISSVNSFRIIFNKYFNTALPLLKDSTILLY